MHEIQILNWEHKPFIPYMHLQDLLTEALVRGVIEDCVQTGDMEEYQREEMIEAVLDGGLRVFGILSVIQRERLLPNFARNDKFIKKSLDAKLPHGEHELKDIVGDAYREFYDVQWRFLAPVFEPNSVLRVLDKESILPFITMDTKSEGGFSNVYVVKLLGAHQRLVDGGQTEVRLSGLGIASCGC